jgi:putrescine transport system substrate-binding protein
VATAEEPVVNVYNWSDYIGVETLEAFEVETGIEVNYDTYDSSEIVEAKLLTGSTGYDVVVHGGQYSSRLIPLGVFLPIDRTRIATWQDLDPVITNKMQKYDPGNRFMAPYMWGTVGMSYNLEMIRKRMPDAPLDSGDMVFKPEVVSKFADCGVTFLESPTEVIPMALRYLGLDQDSSDPDDLARASELFAEIRPYIKYFSSTRNLIDLPNKEVCIAMSWSGDYAVARARAEEAGIDIELSYEVPKEGSFFWFDGFVIPVDAPHPDNAHRFIDFVLRSKVIAKISNETGYANAVTSSYPHLDPEIANDPAIYPTPEILERLEMTRNLPPKEERRRARVWARLKANR